MWHENERREIPIGSANAGLIIQVFIQLLCNSNCLSPVWSGYGGMYKRFISPVL